MNGVIERLKMKTKVHLDVTKHTVNCYSFIFLGKKYYVDRDSTDYNKAQLFKEIDEEIRKVYGDT